MFVVMRKFPEEQQWTICGAFADVISADKEIEKQEKSGRHAQAFPATHVWIAENGNHTWTA